MGDSIFKHHTYGEAVKKWNEDVFGKSIFAFPRKGYSAYNQVQDIRAGKSIDKPKSIADLKKVQEPKKAEPKKTEPKKEEKKAEPKKTKAEKEAEAKAKAETKEKAVKSIISNLMQDEKKEEPKEQLISGGGRKSKEYEKEQEKRYINDISKSLNNINSYYRDSWKSLNQQERYDAYNEINLILDYQYNKSGATYDALKDKIDQFVIPDYAKKGFELWKNKGKMSRAKPLKGRAPNTAYDKMQNKGIK
jgi:hypothetical protein